jgi:ubiquinone/menaquinone biosynthesis C-methylase UbiE
MNNEELKKIIICPKCKNEINFDVNELICPFCNTKFFWKEGVLDMFMIPEDKNYYSVVDANIKYHNGHAKMYNKVTATGNYKRTEEIFKKFENKKHGRMLDIGCGTGEHLDIAKKYFSEIFGIDCSIEMLKLAKNFSPNIVRADVGNVPFRSNYFDFINCFSVLHHCYTQTPLLKEAFRLLKKSGILYTDNDSNKNFYKIFNLWLIFRRKFLRKKEKYLDKKMKILEKKAEYHHKKGLNPNELKRELKHIGFSEVKIIYHYPDNPDLFTKIIKLINKITRINSFYYYFSIIAKK